MGLKKISYEFIGSMEDLWDKIKRTLVQFTHFQKRNRIKRYGFPLVLILLVFLVKHYFHPILGDNSAFLLVSFVVAASSWYGGFGPGIFATFLSALAAYFLYLSQDLNTHPFSGDLIVLTVFIIEGLIISITSEARYEMEKQKDEFISFVSHELKNPLAAIKGFAQLIGRSRKIDTRITSYGEQIGIQSDRVLELINDLLDITTIEIGKFTYKNEIFNIDDLAKEVILHQRMVSPNRIVKIAGGTKKMIYGDKYRIGQVIVNLLTNAIKYSPDNTLITLKLKEQRDLIYVSVKDYGIGIAKDEQSRIFNRYYRTKNVQKKRSEGLGLGLYITNQIIKHHSGKIWVQSKLGKGSTFAISLPTIKT